MAFLSHGDTRHIMIIPSSVEECYTMAMEAFDIAERFQTPVFVMMDLDLGMNNWMSDGFKYPEKPIDRGKRLDAGGPEKLGEWGRYKDVDGDGIAYRTVPATACRPFYARFGPQRQRAVQRAARRLRGQHGSARAQVRHCANGRAQADHRHDAGRADRIHRVRDVALGDRGKPRPAQGGDRRQDVVPAACVRTRSLTSSGRSSTRMSGFMWSSRTATRRLVKLMAMEMTPARIAKIRSVLHYNGLPIDARSITDDVLAQEGYEVATTTADHAVRERAHGYYRGRVRKRMATTKVNRIGLEPQVYKGSKTTLCAGCGHNAISERIIDAFYEMGVDPARSSSCPGSAVPARARLTSWAARTASTPCTAACLRSATGAMLANRSSSRLASAAMATPGQLASASSCT